MREPVVDSQVESRDVRHNLGGSDILQTCESKLLDIEQNLSSSVCTFEAVQWALFELQRLELYEPNSVPRDPLNEDEEDEPQFILERRGISAGNEENVQGILQSKILDVEMEDLPADGQSGMNSVYVVSESVQTGVVKKAEGPERLDVQVERDFAPGSSGKRKPNENASTINETEKRAKVRDTSTLKKVVTIADHGEAGKRMVERINSKFAVPERIYLTNLVSHCLLVSLDQIPTESVEHAIASPYFDNKRLQNFGRRNLSVDDSEVSGFDSKAAVDDGDVPSAGESMWLLRWLAGTILSDAGDNGPFASLDWLVAFMTATHQSLIKSILDDLATDLLKRELEGSATLSSYMRRIGVLEYAALRDPEQTFGKLRPLLPPARFPVPGNFRSDDQHDESVVEIWQGWFGLMALCPKLFAVVSCFYVPVLSVDVIKSWRVNPSTKSLPAIWTMLLDSCIEEPGTTKEWFYVAIQRRLPELASVASDFVLLLSELTETSADQGSNSVATKVGNNLSTLLYRTLSTEILPKALGSTHDLHAEAFPDSKKNRDMNDISLFMENLKQHCHLLWNKAVERFSAASCTCCEIQRNDESYLESYRTEHGIKDGSICVETSGEDPTLKVNDKNTFEIQRGCLYRDPLIRLCQLTLLCCSESVVADLLVNSSMLSPSSSGSFDTPSLRRLVMVLRMMWIISGQGQQRSDDILELWAQQMTNRAAVATTDQALRITLAMRELLDPNFWQNYECFLGSSRHSASTLSIPAKGEAGRQPGLSWKIVHRGIRKVLDRRWLNILPLMHRDDAWDLKLAVLGVLQLLNPDANIRPQVVADRLTAALGILFSWLERCDNGDSNLDGGQAGTTTVLRKPRWRWHYACANEHLKCIIIELSSSSLPSFTLMVNSLLDFSFEYTTEIFTKAVLSSTSGRSLVCLAPLSTGKLDRYGKLVLTSGLASELSTRESPQASGIRLTEENQRIQSGGNPSLQRKKNERVSGVHVDGIRYSASSAYKPTPEMSRQHLLLRSKIANAELGSLLRRTLERAVSKSVELLDAWPCHPVNVLATQLADRLETPHEVPMKMEQYEEVLPKYISSPRHIFLTDCFSQYPLLMEMVELVVKHGGNRALRCVEFVRVLLADSISSWHGTFRPRWPHSLLQPKGEVDEAWNRMQASRLIQLVASANWLPPPLAASAEIVGVIDGSDISDLLLLVWRCMHHTITFGPKAWEESSSNLHAMESQGMSSPGSGADEEGGKEGTFTEWEGHFFAILRRNVSKIGAHFAQVYPVRKAL